MYNWQKYFKLKQIRPGKVVFPEPFGIINFDSEVDLSVLKALFEDNTRFLELTDEGFKELYNKVEENINIETHGRTKKTKRPRRKKQN